MDPSTAPHPLAEVLTLLVPVLRPVVEWYCPNCGLEDRAPTKTNEIRYHTCHRLRFMSAPMVRKGISAKVTIAEREDYVGREMVQLDPERKRPVMSITTTRDDGSSDVVVFAPTATARADA